MLLINSDTTLRQFLPNAFSTVEGESSLFDKLTPWLQTAELWLQQKITGTPLFKVIASDPTTSEYLLSCRIITATAFKSAIPSLDLVLTPNGFGIVSNTNIAPASKERIDRLIQELEDSRCNDIEALLDTLPQHEEWVDSLPYRFWSATLFPNITVAREVTTTKGSLYDSYIQIHPRIIAIEQQLADKFLSPELLTHLRLKLATAPADLSNTELHVIKIVRAEITSLLNGNPPHDRRLIDLVNFIRLRPDEFIPWHNSSTAQLFSPPTFENKKSNTGYWF